METRDLFNILSEEVRHKVDIYFAPQKIDKYFKDMGYYTNEVSVTNKEGDEIELSVLKIVSGKVSGGQDVAEKVILDARDKAKVIVKKYDIENNPNELFHYLGPGHFTLWGEELDSYEPEQNDIVQRERIRQEKIIKGDTALFTFKTDKALFVSIGNEDNFDKNMLASYGPVDPHGILGLIERKLSEDIILINPFWIWNER
ncbi:hypothetical protein [Saccharicrinis sp. 156]|uniref:hypothetical protein n=1 Tax=Saccharicrinis sp. 156 TaxID=3417574 RepID=UPI003D35044F